MATSRDTFESVIYVNNEQAQDALMELNQKLEKLQKSYANLNKNSKNHEQRERELAKQIKATEASIATAEKGTESYARAMNNLGKRSIEQLYKLQRQLNSEIRKLDPNDAEFAQLSKNYQTVTQRIHALEEAQKGVLASQGGFFKRMTVGLSKYYGALMVGVGTVKKVANSFMESYKTISDFQQANADLSTILGVNVKQMGALTENALALGRSTEYTASQVTQLQTELAKLGFNQGEIIDMSQTLELTDKRSVAAFNTFLRGAEESLQLRCELENLDGELQRISEERLDTVEGSIKLMQSAWEGFILSMCGPCRAWSTVSYQDDSFPKRDIDQMSHS